MRRTIREVPHNDARHLRAAEGWLALGNFIEANGELELVSPEYRTHPDYLLLRLAVLREGNVWQRISRSPKRLSRSCQRLQTSCSCVHRLCTSWAALRNLTRLLLRSRKF